MLYSLEKIRAIPDLKYLELGLFLEVYMRDNTVYFQNFGNIEPKWYSKFMEDWLIEKGYKPIKQHFLYSNIWEVEI